MKPVLFMISALVAWMPSSSFAAKYASEYPVSVLVVTSKTRAFHNEVIDVRVEVRNRAPDSQSVPDPESLELGFEHIPGDGSQLAVYTDYRVEPSPPRMITIDGLSSRVIQRRFSIPAGDGTIVVRVLNWPCVPCPVIVDAKEKKTAEPGATDNPDDAQRLREDQ